MYKPVFNSIGGFSLILGAKFAPIWKWQMRPACSQVCTCFLCGCNIWSKSMFTDYIHQNIMQVCIETQISISPPKKCCFSPSKKEKNNLYTTSTCHTLMSCHVTFHLAHFDSTHIMVSKNLSSISD